MKSKGSALALITFASTSGFSATALGGVCYDVGGTVTTENVTPTTQVGSIDLELMPSGSSGTAFDETGSLVGNITGSEGFGATLLSHTATL